MCFLSPLAGLRVDREGLSSPSDGKRKPVTHTLLLWTVLSLALRSVVTKCNHIKHYGYIFLCTEGLPSGLWWRRYVKQALRLARTPRPSCRRLSRQLRRLVGGSWRVSIHSVLSVTRRLQCLTTIYLVGCLPYKSVHEHSKLLYELQNAFGLQLPSGYKYTCIVPRPPTTMHSLPPQPACNIHGRHNATFCMHSLNVTFWEWKDRGVKPS